VDMLLDITLDIILVVLLVDLASGFVHWLEDSYGRAEWPVTGALITRPNILHHKSPTAFTHNSWLRSADVLLVMGGVIIAGAWMLDMLSWQLLLFVAIGANANEVHKWAHIPAARRYPIVRYLQRFGVLQTPHHHAQHHLGNKDSAYCAVTNLVNPVVDAVGLWRGLEKSVEWLFGVTKRPDVSLVRNIDQRLHSVF
jgi:hypothetical protein